MASLDRPDAPLLWTKADAFKFNWLWCNVTCYEPLVAETVDTPSLLAGALSSGFLDVSVLLRVKMMQMPVVRDSVARCPSLSPQAAFRAPCDAKRPILLSDL